jgi:hypothetical protein
MVSPVLEFVIEAACLTGVVLLAAVSTPILSTKPWGWRVWLRSTGVLIVGLVYLVVNPWGTPDPFWVVIGCSAFAAGLVGLGLAVTLAWRLTHRERRTELDRQASVNFAATGMFGLLAATCLLIAGVCSVRLAQVLGEKFAYEHAPNCAIASQSACRLQADGRVVRTWAEGSKGPHWIEMTVADRNQTVEIETAYNVWDVLVPGKRVALTSWKGHVTEVILPGVGTMHTWDSPNFALIPLIAFLVISLVGLLAFSGAGFVYWLKWRAALQRIDPSEIAA